MNRILIIVLALLAGLSGPHHSATAQESLGIELSADARAAVDRAADYLNRVSTMQARFAQISSKGSYAEGNVYMWRPGKLRFEYDAPVPFLMVADGIWMAHYDFELEQATHVPLSSTPAALILEETVSFSEGVTVTAVDQRDNLLEITLVETEEPGKGQLTLTFSDKPLQLRQWTVVDAQGVATTVTVMNPRFGLELEPRLFWASNIETMIARREGRMR